MRLYSETKDYKITCHMTGEKKETKPKTTEQNNEVSLW